MTAATSKPVGNVAPSPLSTKPPYDGTGPSEWAFQYDGPVSATDVGTCAMCTAASRGQCPKHETPALHCSSCQAARHKHCHNHCGIARALAEHPNTHVLGTKDQATFGIVQKAITDAASALTGTNVYVKALGTDGRISLDIFTR
jgi:hypothetical protein